LNTAFDILDLDGDNTLTPEQLVSVLRLTSSEKSNGDDTDRLEMIVRLIDNKAKTTDEIHLQDGEISREDMHELIVFYSMPLKMKPMSQPKFRFALEVEALEERAATAEEADKEQILAQIEAMKEMGVLKWCAAVKPVYALVHEWGANLPIPGAQYWPWHTDSIWAQTHTVYFLFYLGYSVFSAADMQKGTDYKMLLFFSMIYQAIYLIVLIIAEMRPWQKLHFFNIRADEMPMNYCNLGLLICLVLEFLSGCNESCFDETQKDDSNKTNIAFSVLGKIFQVMSYSVETPTVLLLLKSVFKTLPTLGPHLGLFLSIYYGFAGMGISFFCGLLRQHPLPYGPGGYTSPPTGIEGYWHGPGYWGQRKLSGGFTEFASPCDPANSGALSCDVGISGPAQVCPAGAETGLTWGSTSYGSNPFYYNLNFDGFPNAIATLYVVMIQNNWTTAADGGVSAKGNAYRWFFFVFTIVNAFVMINVLVGAIIDAVDEVRQEMVAEQAGETDPLEDAVSTRISCTRAPSGKLYGATWQLGDIPLHGEVRYDAKLVPTLFAGDDAELQRKKVELTTDLISVQHELSDLEDRRARLEKRLASVRLADKQEMKNPLVDQKMSTVNI